MMVIFVDTAETLDRMATELARRSVSFANLPPAPSRQSWNGQRRGNVGGHSGECSSGLKTCLTISVSRMTAERILR